MWMTYNKCPIHSTPSNARAGALCACSVFPMLPHPHPQTIPPLTPHNIYLDKYYQLWMSCMSYCIIQCIIAYINPFYNYIFLLPAYLCTCFFGVLNFTCIYLHPIFTSAYACVCAFCDVSDYQCMNDVEFKWHDKLYPPLKHNVNTFTSSLYSPPLIPTP